MGTQTAGWKMKQSPPRKSRVVGPGAPGAHGSHAVRPAGLAYRVGVDNAPHPVSRCCRTAQDHSTSHRPASRRPALVRDGTPGRGNGAVGPGDRGGRWRLLVPSPASNPPPHNTHATLALPCSGWRMECLVSLVSVFRTLWGHRDTPPAVPSTPKRGPGLFTAVWEPSWCSPGQ